MRIDMPKKLKRKQKKVYLHEDITKNTTQTKKSMIKYFRINKLINLLKIIYIKKLKGGIKMSGHSKWHNIKFSILGASTVG